MSFLGEENLAVWRRGPDSAFESVAIWLGEAVFGHRIWNRQSPWLVFLEFLNIAEAFHRKGALLDQAGYAADPTYHLRYRKGLRHILFNGGDVARIATSSLSDSEKWNEWLARMSKLPVQPREGFGYLQNRFPRFSDFAELVRLLRQTAIESGDNVRWSSRFIFPMGAAAIYSDAALPGSGSRMVRDYTVFGRSGELLYQILTRSGLAAELRPHLTKLLFSESASSRLVQSLCAPSDEDAERFEPGISFLPYKAHPAFERVAQDWLAIFNLGLAKGDFQDHLATHSSLHLLLYQLETAAAVLGEGRPAIVCEIVARKRELVRQHASQSYITNDGLVRRSLLRRVTEGVERARKGVAAAGETGQERMEAIADRLFEDFHLKLDVAGITTDEQLDDLLTTKVEQKLDQNDGLVHLNYGRAVGLISRRGTVRHRYAPSDALLKTLVLTRVPRRVEFGLFLEDIYDRYRIVIGPEEARREIEADTFDRSSFDRNRERLEWRLTSMGLLNRLSDGCAYVVNPLASAEKLA